MHRAPYSLLPFDDTRKQTKNRENEKLFSELGMLKTAATGETFALLMEVKAMKLPTMQNKTAKVL